MREGLIIDLFAGGGGASTGIELYTGRHVDIAVNYDPEAIRLHATNHPDTLHLTEDIFEVDLQKYVKGCHVALMWASPDCTQFSKAKGGKPREKGQRVLPWAVHKHAEALKPDVIIMENVEEIQQWGPLDVAGHPIKERAGEDYRKFITAMISLGYVFDSRELVAADYGAPTTRKRWYAIFRRDGKPVVWPEKTHSKGGANGLKPWEPIYKYLDLWDFGKSIFGRKKPLAKNTVNRIAHGLDKFVFNNPEPFIVQVNHSGDTFRGQSMGEPLPTITQKHGFGMVTPLAVPYMMRNNHGAPGSDAKDPILTITTGGHHGLITPYMMQIGQTGFTKDRNRTLTDPLSTIVTKNEHCMISPLLIQYHSETAKSDVRGQQVTEPIMTLDTSNRYALVMGYLTKFYKSGCGQSLSEPIHTITTSTGHFGTVNILAVPMEELLAGMDYSIKEQGELSEIIRKCTWVSQFIMEYYGCGTGQSLNDPLHTIVTKDRFALVTVLENEYVILDIFLRMLKPRELMLGQGFPEDYILDHDYTGRKIPVCQQVAKIGNSVVPIMAEKLVEANCPYLKIGDRIGNMRIDYSEPQARFA